MTSPLSPRLRRTLTAALVTGLLVTGIAACGDKPGKASPATGTGAVGEGQGGGPIPTDQPENSVPGKSSGGAGPLADKSPCDITPPEAVTQLGASGRGQEEKVGIVRGCKWQVSGKFVFSVGIVDVSGIDLLAADQKQPITVGSHDAVKGVDGTGCAIAIATSPTSRVDAAVSGAEGDLCGPAMQLAQAVEPGLPPQQK